MKRILLLLVGCLLVVSCKSKSNIVTSKDVAIEKGTYNYKSDKNSTTKTSKKKKYKTNKLQNDIVNSALDYIGTRYKTGGSNAKGMDCSGLVFTTFTKYDIRVPRTAFELSQTGEQIPFKKAQPGDLIFFKTNKRSKINHVGIVTEVIDDQIKFVHASTSQGVIVSSTYESYYKETFEQINRIL